MENKKRNSVATVLLTIVCILWMYPIVLILINSLKKEVAITTSGVFSLPTSETWNGVANFVASVTQMDFLKSFWYSLVISVMSVVLIMLCCSMAAWYIVRVNGTLSKIFYYLCVFSMVVPFQMVMFTLSGTADSLHLNTPWGIVIVYLGFGAGLAVFMFTGFVKSIPVEVEEAAMIDGCSPLRTFFCVVVPMMKPTFISVGILEAMWIWNDFLLPYLVLDIKEFKTISIVIQYMKGSYGRVDMGAIMACLIMAIIPVVVFYLCAQKYIVKGVAAMALSKGAYAIHQSGKWYTNDNIDQMLMQRHITKCAKRASSKNHIKGHKKRSNEDNIHFAESFEKLVLLAQTKKG